MRALVSWQMVSGKVWSPSAYPPEPPIGRDSVRPKCLLATSAIQKPNAGRLRVCEHRRLPRNISWVRHGSRGLIGARRSLTPPISVHRRDMRQQNRGDSPLTGFSADEQNPSLRAEGEHSTVTMKRCAPPPTKIAGLLVTWAIQGIVSLSHGHTHRENSFGMIGRAIRSSGSGVTKL